MSAIRADQPQTLAAAEKFAADNKNTYGALAALEVAQQYVDKNELDKARMHSCLRALLPPVMKT